MILAKLNNSKRYEILNPLFPILFKFIEENDLSKQEKGRVSLVSDDLYINIVEFEMKNKEEQIIEVHKDYIDVHIPISTTEIIGWKDIEQCELQIQAYSKEQDCALYSDSCSNYITVNPDECLIVFPEDGHAPGIGQGKIIKAIAKVKVSKKIKNML